MVLLLQLVEVELLLMNLIGHRGMLHPISYPISFIRMISSRGYCANEGVKTASANQIRDTPCVQGDCPKVRDELLCKSYW